MDSSYTFPKLRWPIELKIEQIDKDELLLIRCPIGVSSEPLLLIAAVAPVVATLDGSLSFQQIVDKFSGIGLSEEILKQLLETLDRGLFLANENYFAAEKRVKEEFVSLEERPPFLAGLSYPRDSSELGVLIDSYLKSSLPFSPVANKQLLALVSPHIDYRRGGTCYGKIYPSIATSDADLFIMIGTNHQFSRTMFQLTKKHFISPLGKVVTERDFVSKVAQGYGERRAFADEFVHKREHSLELQLPFFSRLKPQATIVPILVGSFHDMLLADREPKEWEEYESFVSTLTGVIQEYKNLGKKICFVAGVDMAHVGRAFGDPGSLTPEFMREIASKDSEYLGFMVRGDKDGFFQHVASDRDSRRICGFPTMYTILDAMSRLGIAVEGNVVEYSQAVDYTSDCAVTFAGVTLEARSPMGVL
jgi:AmmeMemoRadiSam system protein B